MNGKFLVYAVVVTALSTGINWTRFISSAVSSSQSSNSGSSWSSHTSGSGGTWGSGSSGGSHK